MRHSLKGFTLIELLGVIAIILILSAITLRISTYVRVKAARTKVEGAMAQMIQGCQRYMADYGKYPDNLGASGYSLTAQANTDPWGITYRYRKLNDREFVVGSFGPDMRPGIANFDDDMEDRDPVTNVRINPWRVTGVDTSLWTELGYGDDIVAGDSSVKVRLPPL